MRSVQVLAGWECGFVEYWTEWAPWNRDKTNWRTFTLAHIALEVDPKHIQIDVVLLGLGVCVTWWDEEEVERLSALAREALK